MKPSDKNLGMDRRITRRDLLHGVGAVAAGSFVPGKTFADQMLASEVADNGAAAYPPALTGLRGSHVGSFEVAHKLAREGKTDWGLISDADDGQVYDLVVVGGGLSGLAAAYFFRHEKPSAKILILDNHDDFGGHARRNEFSMAGRMVLGYGGSQTLEEPGGYSKTVKKLLRDLGVDVDKFYDAYDHEFFRRHGLGGACFFDGTHWGSSRLVPYDMSGLRFTLPLANSSLSAAEAVDQMPMSPAAKVEMLHLLTNKKRMLPRASESDVEDYLYSVSYRDFIAKYLGIREPEVFAALQYLTSDSSVGIERTTAGTAILYVGLPGAEAAGFSGEADEDEEPYIHHFPDGNASVGRLMVRSMIPGVAGGSTMEDVVPARFDYSKLDSPDNNVRLRLNSTAVHAENDGNPKSAKDVSVTYVRNGKACRVRARGCVMACYNAMIPAICPDMPLKQREGLANAVKSPMLYTNVGLRNWHAWKKLGVGAIASSGAYHVNSLLDFPVDLGDYRFAKTPDDPIVVHMERFFHKPNKGLNVKQQLRAGRHDLYSTSFEKIERNIRSQLAAMLADGDFDPARDIEAITVNRWAHGYAYGYDWLEDEWYGNMDNKRYPHVQGRQQFGRIAIANSDAGALATFDSAVDQAHRAVRELI